MQNLSQNQPSKKQLDSKSGTKSKPISKRVEKELQEASLVTNEKTHARRFVDNIDKMRNPHIRDCVSLSEKYGTIEDYSKCQEQRDLENYKSFINSSAYDDIKETESEIGKKLTLINLRKISGMHDD